MQALSTQVAAWMVRMESNLSRGNTLMEDLNNRCMLFLQVISCIILHIKKLVEIHMIAYFILMSRVYEVFSLLFLQYGLCLMYTFKNFSP